MEVRVSNSCDHASRRQPQVPPFNALSIDAATLSVLVLVVSLAVWGQTSQKAKLPRPQRLDVGITLRRDPATGVLNLHHLHPIRFRSPLE
jgi:hypothetical protein